MTFQDIFKKSFLNMGEASSISLEEMLVVMGVSFLIGIFIFFVYKRSYQGVLYTHSFNISLVMITMVTAMVIMTISSNVILSLGMVGALSIVRFRTAIKDPMDIVFMFWAIAVGIATGAQFYPIALVGSAVVAMILILLSFLKGRSAPFLLVINHEASHETQLQKELRNILPVRLKSKVVSPENIEATYELRIKENESEFVNRVIQLKGVKSAMLISHSGHSVF